MPKNLEQAKLLWAQLGDVPINEEEEIDIDWTAEWTIGSLTHSVPFAKGTDKYEIWYWFEEEFDLSVAEDLMGTAIVVRDYSGPDPDGPDALIRISSQDYELSQEQETVWISIKTPNSVAGISVYIHRTDEGVAVDLYPLNREMEDSLGGTWALFADAEPEDDND